MAKKPVAKKKKLKNIPNGIAYIHSTFNNTVVTITDAEGKVVIWKSGGTSGFKGTKKGSKGIKSISAPLYCPCEANSNFVLLARARVNRKTAFS